MVKRRWGNLQKEVLGLIWDLGGDGVTPSQLAEKLEVEPFVAAVYLSRWKKQGILLKQKTKDGCRYCMSSKGERKQAYLKSMEEKEVKDGIR